MPFVCRECPENPCYLVIPLESVKPDACILLESGAYDDNAVEWEHITFEEMVEELKQWTADMLG
jgi:hypothetical protein